MALDDAVLAKMVTVDRPQVSRAEAEILARMVQTPEEIAEALWRYAAIGWLRGQRYERACRLPEPRPRSWIGRLLARRA